MPNGIGELFSILSAAAWAVGVILYRRLGESLPPLQLNFLKNCLVFMMLIPAIPLLHGIAIPQFDNQQIL
ncbi:MAG: EamA family transporter, partial [Arenimonas sp.]